MNYLIAKNGSKQEIWYEEQGCQIEPISAFLADLNFFSRLFAESRFYIFILMTQPLRVLNLLLKILNWRIQLFNF